jgi:hypothetical protein
MSDETAADSTSYELALSGDLTDAERADYWQRAYERMAARNGELSLTIIRMQEALREARSGLCAYTGGAGGACEDTIRRIDLTLTDESAA